VSAWPDGLSAAHDGLVSGLNGGRGTLRLPRPGCLMVLAEAAAHPR
jgi:hypothetical protein